MTVCPFGSKLIICSLHKDLSIHTLLPTTMGRINRLSDRLSLSAIGTIVLLFKCYLPFLLMVDNKILKTCHVVFWFVRFFDTKVKVQHKYLFSCLV